MVSVDRLRRINRKLDVGVLVRAEVGDDEGLPGLADGDYRVLCTDVHSEAGCSGGQPHLRNGHGEHPVAFVVDVFADDVDSPCVVLEVSR